MTKHGYTNNMDNNEKLLIAIIRVSESYKKESTKIFNKYNLSFSKYTILRLLESSENRQNTFSNLSKLMLVSGANITPMAKRLEKDGLITKLNDHKDERLTFLKITQKGIETIENIANEKDHLIDKYLCEFSEEKKKDLLASMKSILYRFSSL